MPFYSEKKRSNIFPSFRVPLCAPRLAKCCFCNKSKIEKDFEKKKWHVKIHAKMPFY